MADPSWETMDMLKHIDMAEFRKLGYLQELNRTFLHPLGLAMAVNVAPDGTEQFAGIVDCRDDDEGVFFAKGAIDPAKSAYVAAERDLRAEDRIIFAREQHIAATLGVQDVPPL